MAELAKAAANYFLDKTKASGGEMTSMKLQKLLYFAQGWHLAVEDRPLFDEQIEAWQWGPVVPTVWREFKDLGSRPIDRKATIAKLNNLTLAWDTPELLIPESRQIVDAVWDGYKDYSAAQLMSLTHQKDAPWHDVFDEYGGKIPLGTDIPLASIKKYFKAMLAE